MLRLMTVAVLAASAAPLATAQGTISTFAGTGSAGMAGDGGAALTALLDYPIDVNADGAGNVYIADQNNNKVRRVDKNGVITTFAGNGTMGFSGDGGPATSAELNSPICVFADPYGTGVYISDVGNQRIRFVDTKGIITTVAGNGGKGFGGDGGPATSATFYNSVRVITDVHGDIFIADQSNHRIRKITRATGIIETFAGTGVQGFNGDGGPATSAELNNPTSLTTDALGNIFFCDQFNHRIREVNTSGVIATIAGTGTAGFSGDGGPATAAQLNYPGGMTMDSDGNLFFSDDTNNRVREIVAADGTIKTVAGNGVSGFSGDGGPATSASLDGNFGVTIDPLGDLLIADSKNNRVRSVTSASSATPSFGVTSLTNGASFASGSSAGALATLFGTRLTLNLNGVLNATQLPLPTTLNGTSVTLNGVAAPILAVSNNNQFGGQINLQIPWELAGQTTVSVVVNNGQTSNAALSIPITAEQPGVFEYLDSGIGQNVGIATHLDYTLVSSSKPAAKGEVLIVYGTGSGPLNPALVTGTAAPASPLSYAAGTTTVTIGGIGAIVSFSGAAPDFVGLNQFNVTVPANAPSGLQPMVVSVNGVASPPVSISIQ